MFTFFFRCTNNLSKVKNISYILTLIIDTCLSFSFKAVVSEESFNPKIEK